MILRAATLADADFLFRLRTDPATAWASRGDAPDRLTHAAWLTRTLADRTRRLYVAESSGVAVGTVRLDRRDADRAEVSVTVAPEARRLGLGRAVLELVEDAARAWGVTWLEAEIKPDNAVSQRLFTRQGYVARAENGLWEKRLCAAGAARMRRYTVGDFGKAQGWSKREVEAYRKQAAWNRKMERILKRKPEDAEVDAMREMGDERDPEDVP